MNKETIKFLWEIYTDLVQQKELKAGEDYPLYELDEIMKKLK